MVERLLALYHRLPAPARSAAATLRGWYLRSWRYGGATERLIEEALDRESWSDERWRAWTEARLAEVLHRAATRVPYYRAYWSARRRSGDTASWELLAHWPALDKDAVRQNPRAFLADDCDPRRMFHVHTSGTTGKPIEVWRTRATVKTLYALAAARTREWLGIPPHVRWARLGGQLVIPVSERRPPFWVWNAAMRQLYMSSYHLAPDLIPAYLDALVRYRIGYLAGYTSSLCALAREAVRLKRRDLRMAAVFTNAEPVTPESREVIGAAFQCPVLETYGMAENVAAASECRHGRLHRWPEVGHVEVMDGGELVCTGLLNGDMPLIRYRVGDRGRMSAAESPCPCGRTLPVMLRVDGRVTDLLVTRDGRKVFWLNPVFYGLPVRETQIVQQSLDRLTVRVAPAPGFDAGAERAIVQRLVARMGEVRVDIELVEEVPRTANGKLQSVVCRLSAERLAEVGAA
jgi:phenylacetate-CoA ligase